jgi:lipopolysaccharide/colanic/teichoic acid biosynthesis glycosyltransferase/nucleoside-diphosphate-sugar epimerase
MRVLVTGANGFVGRPFLKLLNSTRSINAIGSLRRAEKLADTKEPFVVVGDINAQTDWSFALAGVQVVVHTAACVHVMADMAVDTLEKFQFVNVQGTLNLARQASSAGVQRFVFVSSIKVNGDSTKPGFRFKAEDTPVPLDAYGASKMEAEQGLLDIALQTGMEVVIIRPPLVYGPGVKANFATIIRLLKRGVPLPLGAINNQRSLVSLHNLMHLLVTCLTHPAAANQTFLVSDGEDVSTTDLLRRMGQVMSRPARLVPVPVNLLKLGAVMLGRQDLIQRLCGSLQVDIEKTRRLLDWTPPISLDEGLKLTVTMNSGDKSALNSRGEKYWMKRLFDLLLGISATLILSALLLLVALVVRLTSAGPVIYWSNRMGRHNKLFKMPKFRTMQVGTPSIATHLISHVDQHLTPIGSFLRKSSLDELPQLWSIVVGDMSFVGPRPALFNQDDLIALRMHHGVDKLVPGLTGWAQVNGRDALSIPVKVQYELEYLHKQSFWFDMKILGLTFLKVVRRVGVSH